MSYYLNVKNWTETRYYFWSSGQTGESQLRSLKPTSHLNWFLHRTVGNDSQINQVWDQLCSHLKRVSYQWSWSNWEYETFSWDESGLKVDQINFTMIGMNLNRFQTDRFQAWCEQSFNQSKEKYSCQRHKVTLPFLTCISSVVYPW